MRKLEILIHDFVLFFNEYVGRYTLINIYIFLF